MGPTCRGDDADIFEAWMLERVEESLQLNNTDISRMAQARTTVECFIRGCGHGKREDLVM